MTKEEELDWLCRLRSEIYVYMPKEWLIPMNNALDMAIKALEQEPCEDCVSRQAVIDTIYTECSGTKLDIDFAKVLMLQRAIKVLPSVTPIRPKGQWLMTWDGECKYECSECGMGSDVDYAYCLRCGAKMESEG